MTQETARRLMESIAANRLTVLCGAGLSMAPPSSLPSAAAIAEQCANIYQERVGSPLASEVASDIERMAAWFRKENRFRDLFIGKLVPWARFNSSPNNGHSALADFLACGAIHVAVTTNFDCLVEDAARLLGEPDFQAIVHVEDLPRDYEHRPYLKIHGCSRIGLTRSETVWCKEQLTDPPIKERLDRFREWMEVHLMDRDVLIVGFWSDWAYLSQIFASSIDAIGPRSVILVDPSPPHLLEQKAPALWQWAHRDNIDFVHERESGAEFLLSLRRHFSCVYLRAALNDAAATYRSLFGEPLPDIMSSLDSTEIVDLYALRKDLSGVARHCPVRAKIHEPQCRLHAAFHARLIQQGAEYSHHTYRFRTETVRLVNGHGRLMSDVKASYAVEPPLPLPADKIVCIGAVPDISAAHVLRPDDPPTVVRPGIANGWIAESEFLPELGASNVQHHS